jgi:UrcA family protein
MTHTVKALAAAVAFIALGGAQAEAAHAAHDPRGVAVRFDDLDLRTEAGASVLLRRLERAAGAACADGRRQRGLAPSTQRACAREAFAEAVDKTNNALVISLYAAREGQRTIFASR